MAKVLIRNKRTGRQKRVRERDARILVQLGRWERAEKPIEAPRARQQPSKPPKITDDLAEMSYNDLRSLASEQDVQPDGRKKDDYIRALRYHRRDMRAE